jgi:prepilin-type N-terminal cleavage/methylation domain-containing protein
MKKFQHGFSLIEIMVVVGIIGILSAVLYVNFSDGSEISRDAQRQADLRTVDTALELYKNKYGEYPAGCNGPEVWSGHAPDYDCPSGNQYIVGLAPEFIPRLPQDPKLNGDDSGYVYATNAEGTVYIMKARLTVESENVDFGHPFQSCDTDNTTSDTPICNRLSNANNGGNRPAWCQENNDTFNTSYGIWGGLAEERFGWIHVGNPGGQARAQEATEDVLCMSE